MIDNESFMMEDLVKKISQYQLFNFLLVGIVFAVLISKTTSIDLIFDNLLIGFFYYYFIGVVMSRLGSLIIEPIFKRSGIVKYESYKNYLRAAKVDSKLDTLSQENNMYRTLVAMLIVFLIVYSLDKYNNRILPDFIPFITIGLLVLFTFSYRKQTKYITKRVNKTNQK